MHCTKLTNITKNVQCPHLKELTDDIDSNRYGLDESNDIAIINIISVLVIHFSHTRNKIESIYLGLAQL